MEHLEWDEPGFESLPQADLWEESENRARLMESPSSVRAQLKVDIIKLLIFCVVKASSTIAHFLLGFPIGKKMSEAQLQEPGKPSRFLAVCLSIFLVSSSVLQVCWAAPRLVYTLFWCWLPLVPIPNVPPVAT